jgi:sulfoxide reductase catalytic subunit YedY
MAVFGCWRARENFLNDGSQRPTTLFIGYGDEVASLYKGLEKEALYM